MFDCVWRCPPHICVVFFLVLFALCCRFLWIVHCPAVFSNVYHRITHTQRNQLLYVFSMNVTADFKRSRNVWFHNLGLTDKTFYDVKRKWKMSSLQDIRQTLGHTSVRILIEPHLLCSNKK